MKLRRMWLHLQVVKFIFQVVQIFIIKKILVDSYSGCGCSSRLCCFPSKLNIRGVIQPIIHDSIRVKFNFMDLQEN